MNTFSKKRKNYELFEETEALYKRRKIEEIILEEISTNNKNAIYLQNRSNVDEEQSQLITAVRLKKKYKYYCRKHNASYLIESVRKKNKEISKENRSKLLQNFRSLKVSVDPSRFLKDGNVDHVYSEAKDVLKRHWCDSNDDNINDDEKNQLKKPKWASLESIENISKENNTSDQKEITSEQDILDKENDQLKSSKLSTALSNRPSKSYTVAGGDDSSDENCPFKKPKLPSFVTIKKDLKKNNITNTEKSQLKNVILQMASEIKPTEEWPATDQNHSNDYGEALNNSLTENYTSTDESDFFDYGKANFSKSKSLSSFTVTNNFNEIMEKNRKSGFEGTYKFIKPKSPPPLFINKSSVENKIKDSDEDSDYVEDYSSTRFSRPNLVRSSAMREGSKEGKIIAKDCKKHRHRKPRVIKFSVLRKIPGNDDVRFSEHEDYIDSDFNENDTKCYCSYHENLKTKLDNYEYESSSSSSNDEDDSSISSYDLYSG